MYLASNGAGRCAILSGNSSFRGYVSSHWSRRQPPADIPGSVVGTGSGGLASSRIHQLLDSCGPFRLPARHRETDGDALSSDVPMRVSLVSPGFPPQLGGVEVVVGYLAEELCGYGHQVTVYAQRPRGSSFPASRDYPVHRFADWSGSRQFPVAPGLVRALWRDRGLFDVIHAHSFHAVPAMMAASVPQVPLVLTSAFSRRRSHQGRLRPAHRVRPVGDALVSPCRQGDLRFRGTR